MKRMMLVFLMLVFLIQLLAQTGPSQAEAPAAILAITVGDIPKGNKANINPEGLVIDESKKVWLNKHQPVGGDGGVTVLHMDDGTLVVEISDDKLRWLRVPVSDDMRKSLLPVNKLNLVKKEPPEKKTGLPPLPGDKK